MRVINEEFPLTIEEAKSFGYGVNYIDKVKEFMTLFGQPVVDKPAIMPEDRNKLRIALIFEELKEYAEASGLRGYFNTLCEEAEGEYELITNLEDDEPPYIEKPIDIIGQFDALLDLQYVLSGAVIENGFNEVHRSNMSKICKDEKEAEQTIEKYSNEQIEVYAEPCAHDDNAILIKKRGSDKVLKSINYSPANLEPIINKHDE
jgi:predicted HAD superfamily Cof-like phosphohydrolase